MGSVGQRIKKGNRTFRLIRQGRKRPLKKRETEILTRRQESGKSTASRGKSRHNPSRLIEAGPSGKDEEEDFFST